MQIRRLAICLSAAVLALPSLASAEDAGITAFAPARTGWLATSGPDSAGLYRVSIKVSDLDASTEAGWSAMASRAERGAVALCDMASEGMQVRGYGNKGRARCLSEAGDIAARQMAEARQSGRPVATLGMAAPAAR